MKLDPRIQYHTAREMCDMAKAALPDVHVGNHRALASEFARRNGYEKTRISISGVRRVYFYKPTKQEPCSK